jgi:hypothetical protein
VDYILLAEDSDSSWTTSCTVDVDGLIRLRASYPWDQEEWERDSVLLATLSVSSFQVRQSQSVV